MPVRTREFTRDSKLGLTTAELELTNQEISHFRIQIQSWKALLDIPYGKTISYKEQAIKIQNEKAHRAVANANAQSANRDVVNFFISIFLSKNRT